MVRRRGSPAGSGPGRRPRSRSRAVWRAETTWVTLGTSSVPSRARGLGGPARGGLHLGAHDHRADLTAALRRSGTISVGLEGAEGPVLVLPDHHLGPVAARGEDDAGSGTGRSCSSRPGALGRDSTVSRSRATARFASSRTTPITSRVTRSRSPFGHDRDGGARHHDGERHVEAVVAGAEVGGLQRHGEVRDREVREQLVLELVLAVLAPGVGEVALRVVARAVLDVERRAGSRGPSGGETGRPSPGSCWRSRARSRPRCRPAPARRPREVVRVEERAAAGVGGERRQRVLRGDLLVELPVGRPAGEDVGAGALAWRASPPGTTASRPRTSTG